MSNTMQVNDWRPAYLALRKAGMTDATIAGVAGVTRTVISAVCSGSYKSEHNLGFNGGMRVLAKLRELRTAGVIPTFSFNELRVRKTEGGGDE